jgi:hypothetical protein
MNKKPNCAVLIPIYKHQLNEDELFSVKTSLSNLQGHDIYWIAPEGLDLSYYNQNFGIITPRFFDSVYFKNITGYNKLLTSSFFYENFIDYEFSLICQPDAIVLKPELQKWLNLPYDYIGAPWPKGYSVKINTKKIAIPEGIICTAFVGNGGLSLRRNQACIGLLYEFADVAEMWQSCGHAEDIFFSILGSISCKFMIPNVRIASQFSYETELEILDMLNNQATPFGVHAWKKYDESFWTRIFSKELK